MDPNQLSMMANKFPSVLDASTLNARGNQLAFCQRQRLLTPFRFGLSLVASMASKSVPSIADLHRDCNALWAMRISYKAFSKQRAKASGAAFLRASLEDLMGKVTRHVLGFHPGQPLASSTG